jgi:UrcA family protein
VASHIKELNMTRTVPTSLAPALLAVSALCLIAASPAAAQSVKLHDGYSHDSSKIVTYASIDPTSAAGARTLLQRIEIAAEAACGGEANMTSDYQKADYRECRRVAVSGAVAKMKSPAVTTLASRRQRERLAAK